MLVAGDLLVEFPSPLLASATVADALKLLLLTPDCRNLPVIDEGHRLVGMVGQRELKPVFELLISSEAHVTPLLQQALAANVGHVMASHRHVLHEDVDVLEIGGLMIEEGVSTLPVVDAAGRFVGMVSYLDLLQELTLLAAAA